MLHRAFPPRPERASRAAVPLRTNAPFQTQLPRPVDLAAGAKHILVLRTAALVDGTVYERYHHQHRLRPRNHLSRSVVNAGLPGGSSRDVLPFNGLLDFFRDGPMCHGRNLGLDGGGTSCFSRPATLLGVQT